LRASPTRTQRDISDCDLNEQQNKTAPKSAAALKNAAVFFYLFFDKAVEYTTAKLLIIYISLNFVLTGLVIVYIYLPF
jgi:hypothetical protein